MSYLGGCFRPQKVLFYYYPFEEVDSALADILGSYGDVESIYTVVIGRIKFVTVYVRVGSYSV